MKILIACEESQEVCKAFRAKGHEAYSCDILPCSGGHPEWHIQGDVLEQLDKGWDMMIAFPPCTHLSVSGARWFVPKAGKFRKPMKLREDALEFVKKLMNAPIEKIAIENPVSVISSHIRKADQLIHPWQFGHPEEKRTCLWLKNLPNLIPTKIVEEEMNRLPKKEKHKIWWMGSNKSIQRSKTYPGIAKAMADQWG